MRQYFRHIQYATERHMMMIDVIELITGECQIEYYGNPTGNSLDRVVNIRHDVANYKEGLKKVAAYIRRKNLKIVHVEKNHGWYDFD